MPKSFFTFRFLTKIIAILSVFLGLSSMSFAQTSERTMIVLDGSGSMWGQIDGVPKLEIARKTLREVLEGVPETMELGLIAYGHREKGNCSDIELIVPPSAGTASTIADKVDNLRFLGKTPLSAAVKMAAEELRYTEEKATVILITDGLETCKADPCALGNSLEEQGVDFTAHVVGFGLSKEQGKQVACLAENTGGKYFSADDGAELIEALNEVVAVNPEVTFIALDQNDNELTSEKLNWLIKNSNGEKVHQSTSRVNISTALDAGDYTIVVSGIKIAGGAEFTIDEQIAQTIYVPVEIEETIPATLEAPDSAAVGSVFEVNWSGPNGKADYVTIVELGAKEGKYLDYAYTANGNPAEITAPDGLGTYELRYFDNVSDKTIATRNIEITPVSATLEAPTSVAAGAEFEVNWTGPNNARDYITIVEVGADEGKYLDYAYTTRGSPLKISAPDGLGTYEIRYVLNQSDRTLVSRKIEITAISATLEVENTAVPGGKIIVNWTGPNNARDYIAIAELGADEGKYSSYSYITRGSPVTIKVPKALGSFEVRYVIGSSKRTLASIPINLSPASGSVAAPSPVAAGGVVEVTWAGPANNNDFIQIVAAGADANARAISQAKTAQGSPLSLFAPDSAGEYEIRYYMKDNKEILASAPLIVE